MKKLFLIILIYIFNNTICFANINKQITIDEIKDILLNLEEMTYSADDKGKIFDNLKISGTLKKRLELRGTARCMYKHLLRKRWFDDREWDSKTKIMRTFYPPTDECYAKHLKKVMHQREKDEKKRPGDVFYALEAIKELVINEKKYSKFIDYNYIESPQLTNFEPAIKCHLKNDLSNVGMNNFYICPTLSKYTIKKLSKFEKDPSNEKLLGKKLLDHIKHVRMIRSIEDKLGKVNYALLGDMLNAIVSDVKRNNIRPDLEKRRTLLEKYSLLLNNLTLKLNDKKIKSLKKDILKSSKTFDKLLNLEKTNYKLDNIISDSIFLLSDLNKLIENSSLKANENKIEKKIALSSIDFMRYSINSILLVMPEKFKVTPKKLNEEMFSDKDFKDLENIMNYIIIRNNEIKSKKHAENINLLNNYIDASSIISSLESLGIKNRIKKGFEDDTAFEIANNIILESIDSEVFKNVRKITEKMREEALSDLTEELSNISNQVSSIAKDATDTKAVKSMQRSVSNDTIRKVIILCRRGTRGFTQYC